MPGCLCQPYQLLPLALALVLLVCAVRFFQSASPCQSYQWLVDGKFYHVLFFDNSTFQKVVIDELLSVLVFLLSFTVLIVYHMGALRSIVKMHKIIAPILLQFFHPVNYRKLTGCLFRDELHNKIARDSLEAKNVPLWL